MDPPKWLTMQADDDVTIELQFDDDDRLILGMEHYLFSADVALPPGQARLIARWLAAHTLDE